MQFQLGIALGQRLQEDDELVPMAPVATPMNLAAGHLQRGKQAGGAMASVIMDHGGGQPRPHRQCRLGTVKRLNLRLFVHAQHQRALWRVQIESDDVGQFGVELRVAAELEGFDPVRLEPILLPDASAITRLNLSRRTNPYIYFRDSNSERTMVFSSKAIKSVGLAIIGDSRIKNSIAIRVLPPPIPLQSKVGRPFGSPSPVMSSSPRIPVGSKPGLHISVNASMVVLRLTTHDSRSRRFATPYSFFV
jgi:hypothetical protein